MLRRLQVQAVANKLAGLEPGVEAKALDQPWRQLLVRVHPAEAGQHRLALLIAMEGMRWESEEQRQTVMAEILAALPGQIEKPPSLAELAASLPPVEWLWPNWIPRGMLSLLGAAPGAGKSMLALDLCRRIIHGESFPDGAPGPNPGANVVYVDAENVPQLLNERAQAWHMDRSRLYLLLPDAYGMLDFGSNADQDRLIEIMYVLEPELVVVDSLSTISTRGENNVEDIRYILGFLSAVAREFQTGMLLIHHLRKRSKVMPILDLLTPDDFRGSSHIIAMARSVLGLSVICDGPQPNRNGPRRLEIIKTNLCPHPAPLGIEFATGPEGEIVLQYTDAPQPYREPTEKDQCATWLVELLQERGEPLKPGEIKDLAEEAGFSRSVLYRARKSLEGTVVNTEKSRAPNNRWALAEWNEDE